MPPVHVLDTLETDRLILRRSTVGEAAIYRQLWTERDPRVPPHRRINAEGRPAVEDIAAQIRAERDENGSPDEPELAYELLRAAHGCGHATEAGRAVVTWASEAGYRRLRAGVWDWNVASRRVLEKLGFREAGRAGPDSIYGHSLLTVRES